MSKRPSETDRPASVTESGDDDAFLSRWARRKRIARTGGDADAREPEAPLDDEMPAGTAPSVGDATVEGDGAEPAELTDEDMPPVDSIDEHTDMSGFFSPKVTQAVKKAALKKFFHSPAFNIVDGLDDYDDDFRSFAALGDIVTSDMRGQMEREAERARENVANGGEAAETAATPEPAAAHVDETDAPTVTADEDSAPGQAAGAEPDEPGITRDPAVHAGAGPAKLRPRAAGEADT